MRATIHAVAAVPRFRLVYEAIGNRQAATLLSARGPRPVGEHSFPARLSDTATLQVGADGVIAFRHALKKLSSG